MITFKILKVPRKEKFKKNELIDVYPSLFGEKLVYGITHKSGLCLDLPIDYFHYLVEKNYLEKFKGKKK